MGKQWPEPRCRPLPPEEKPDYPYVGPKITEDDIHAMIAHWLATPVNGYFGSGYGSDIKALLQTPMNSRVADDFIAKMKFDIPILSVLPEGSVYIGWEDVPPDQKRLILAVARQTYVLEDNGPGHQVSLRRSDT